VRALVGARRPVRRAGGHSLREQRAPRSLAGCARPESVRGRAGRRPRQPGRRHPRRVARRCRRGALGALRRPAALRCLAVSLPARDAARSPLGTLRNKGGAGARMKRLAAGLLLVALLVQNTDALAQPLPRVHRVGVLSPGSAAESAAVQREPFERGLRDLGWTPGSSLIIEYRHAEGRAARLGELARELVRLNVDVIVARSSPGVAAARQATASIPIVMSSGNDPVSAGHVKSLARPGGNVTGIANLTAELEGKRLELLTAPS